MKRPVESTGEFKLRIAATVRGKSERIRGARRPHPLLARKRKARGRKTKRLALLAAAALMSVGGVRALPLSYLIEEQRAKIEPAAKLFQKECAVKPAAKPAKSNTTRW
jgi:hypothetical protein